MESRCPVHNKPLYGNGQTATHHKFKCPDCDYSGDGPGAVRHDLPERYMVLAAKLAELEVENAQLKVDLKMQGKVRKKLIKLCLIYKEILRKKN